MIPPNEQPYLYCLAYFGTDAPTSVTPTSAPTLGYVEVDLTVCLSVTSDTSTNSSSLEDILTDLLVTLVSGNDSSNGTVSISIVSSNSSTEDLSCSDYRRRLLSTGTRGLGATEADSTSAPTVSVNASQSPILSQTPTDTGTPTDTATPTGTGTQTDTATPTGTGTPTDTAAPTTTATQSDTATTPTDTATQTNTASPTDGTPTDTATPPGTGTLIETATSMTTSTPTDPVTPTESTTPAGTASLTKPSMPVGTATPTAGTSTPEPATSMPTPVVATSTAAAGTSTPGQVTLTPESSSAATYLKETLTGTSAPSSAPTPSPTAGQGTTSAPTPVSTSSPTAAVQGSTPAPASVSTASPTASQVTPSTPAPTTASVVQIFDFKINVDNENSVSDNITYYITSHFEDGTFGENLEDAGVQTADAEVVTIVVDTPTLSPTLAPTLSPTLTPTGAETLETCDGYCRDQSAGSCFCDSSCYDYDDCCSDVCSVCGYCTDAPTLQPTPTPTLSPTPTPTVTPTASPTSTPTISPTENLETCDGSLCRGKSDGSCYCDASCIDYGDCCSDACSICGRCTDAPTSQPTNAPTTSPPSQPTDAPTTSPTSQPTDALTTTPYPTGIGQSTVSPTAQQTEESSLLMLEEAEISYCYSFLGIGQSTVSPTAHQTEESSLLMLEDAEISYSYGFSGIGQSTVLPTASQTEEGSLLMLEAIEDSYSYGFSGSPTSTPTISATAHITIFAPVGNTSYSVGALNVSWTCGGLSSFYVAIYLYQNDTLVQDLSSCLASTGFYSAPLDSDLIAGADYWVKVVDVGNNAIYDASSFFSISGFISVSLSESGSYYTYFGGDTMIVLWSYVALASTEVNIHIYKDTDIIETLVASYSASEGRYDTTVPSDLLSGTDYWVRVEDASDNLVFGTVNFCLCDAPTTQPSTAPTVAPSIQPSPAPTASPTVPIPAGTPTLIPSSFSTELPKENWNFTISFSLTLNGLQSTEINGEVQLAIKSSLANTLVLDLNQISLEIISHTARKLRTRFVPNQRHGRAQSPDRSLEQPSVSLQVTIIDISYQKSISDPLTRFLSDTDDILADVVNNAGIVPESIVVSSLSITLSDSSSLAPAVLSTPPSTDSSSLAPTVLPTPPSTDQRIEPSSNDDTASMSEVQFFQQVSSRSSSLPDPAVVLAAVLVPLFAIVICAAYLKIKGEPCKYRRRRFKRRIRRALRDLY